jgi:hypothetical protein
MSRTVEFEYVAAKKWSAEIKANLHIIGNRTAHGKEREIIGILRENIVIRKS